MPNHQEVTSLDKIVSIIKRKIPTYEYSGADFVYVNESFFYWNLAEINQPTNEEINAEIVVKPCPRTCIECLIERIELLESKIGLSPN